MRIPLLPSVFGLALWVADARAEEPCAAPLTASALEQESERARESFEGVRPSDFRAALARLDDQLRCLNEPPGSHTLASWYRLNGLRAFMDKDPEGAKGWFAAANALDPSVASAPKLPAGHPAIALWAEAATLPLGQEEAPPPAEGALLWDGRAGLARPTGRPTLMQRTDESGAVVWTGLLRPADALPDYPVKAVAATPEVPPPAAEVPAERTRHPAVRVALLAGAGGLAAVAITGGVIARATHTAYNEHFEQTINDPSDQQIAAFWARADQLRSTHNTWVGVAGAAGAAALSAATLGLVVRW